MKISVRTLQVMIGSVFVALGGWCLVLPTMVAELGFRPEYGPTQPIVALTVGCFGAQAVLAGVFALFSRFTRATFIAFGIAVLPFFWFDYHFYFVEPVFTPWIALDVVGNVILLAACIYGAAIAPAAARAEA